MEDKGSPAHRSPGTSDRKKLRDRFLGRPRRRTFSRSGSWTERKTNDSQRELSPVNKVGGVW